MVGSGRSGEWIERRSGGECVAFGARPGRWCVLGERDGCEDRGEGVGLGGPDPDGDQQCDLDSEVWQTPTWATVGFTPDGDHRYVYATSSSGTGADASLTVTAHSDLDCDGVQSTFQIFVSPPALPGDAYETSCTPGGTLPRTSPGFYREMLNE